MHLAEHGQTITHLIRDRDSRFTEAFDRAVRAVDATVVPLPYRSPNLNAFAERWVLTLRRECLDHFVVFGARHLDHLVNEYVAFYNGVRPHQSKGNAPLGGAESPPGAAPPTAGRIVCQQRLGGVLRHYYRAAA